MENVQIKGNVYRYVVNYKNDDKLRASFNSLTSKVFGFDLEDWYQNGYWKDTYIPYSILNDTTVISNISVNVIDFVTHGENRKYVQLGTVMTDRDYRNQGLNKFLMEKVLADWRGKCDLIYLFANNTVLDFYPKFGFHSVQEYQHSKALDSGNIKSEFTKLNMSEKENQDLLYRKANQSAHFATLSMEGNAGLIMFYCTSFMDQDVYYSEDFDAIAIATFEDDTLYLKNIFSEKEIALNDIILSLANEKTKRVRLGFTSKDPSGLDEHPFQQDDTLFILDDKEGLLDGRKLMFPVLSHA
ncbi:MAG: GNAT family N-acetyltransferase [Bacteroidota bacterium]